MRFFTFHNPPLPWGDYGRILYAGIAACNHDGQLELERTGPYVPPISIPGLDGIVVTNQFRCALESSSLTGFTFHPVLKKHIVRLPWDSWDKMASEPEYYPASGEPEDYLLRQRHDPLLAEQMGMLWDMNLAEGAEIIRVHTGPRSWDVRLLIRESSWKGCDFFSARDSGYRYCSERARGWFLQHYPDFLTFFPVETAQMDHHP